MKLFKKTLLIISLVTISLIVIGFIYEQISERIDKKVYPPGQMIEVNGHKIHIYCTGKNINGSPTVIMIPGAGSLYFSFDKIQPTLSKYTKVCSYDPSGFGFSEGATDGRTAKDVSNELSQLLINTNISGPYLVVAHSLGGIYAQVFSKDNIDNVKGMVLIDPTCEELAYVKEPELPAFVRVTNWLINSSFYFGVPRLVMTISADSFGVHKDNMKIERAILSKPFKETNATSILTGAKNSLAQEKQARNFGNMPINVLSADGSRQDALEMWGEELANCHQNMVSFSTNSKYVPVVNSGHAIQDDQPRIVINNILELLNK